jgi:hypothetical protein
MHGAIDSFPKRLNCAYATTRAYRKLAFVGFMCAGHCVRRGTSLSQWYTEQETFEPAKATSLACRGPSASLALNLADPCRNLVVSGLWSEAQSFGSRAMRRCSATSFGPRNSSTSNCGMVSWIIPASLGTKSLESRRSNPLPSRTLKKRFEKLWVNNRNNVFCSYDRIEPWWTYDRPPICSFQEVPD